MNYAYSTGIDKPIVKYVLFAVFIIYMLLLSKYILFTRVHTNPENYFSLKHIKASIDKGKRSANLQPFKTIKFMYYGKYLPEDFQIRNLGGNLLGFAPLGILLPLLFKRLRSFLPVVITIFAVSLSYELIQLCTGLGIFDVDDLILNTSGGIIGFIIYFCATLIYGQTQNQTGSGL
jgi:glycopeptide antibiotics resistance protein